MLTFDNEFDDPWNLPKFLFKSIEGVASDSLLELQACSFDQYLAELTFDNIAVRLHHQLPWQRYSWSYFIKTTSTALSPKSYELRSELPDTFPAEGYYGSINTNRGLLDCSSLVESWARVSEYLGSGPIMTRLRKDGPNEIKKLLEDSYSGPLNLFAEMTGILDRTTEVEDFLFTFCAVCYLSLDPPLPPLFVPPDPDSLLAMHVYPAWRFWLLCHFFAAKDCISCELGNEQLVDLIREIRTDCFAENARDGNGLQPMAGLSEDKVIKMITAQESSGFAGFSLYQTWVWGRFAEMKLSHLKLAICPGYCFTRLMSEYMTLDVNRNGIYWCYPPFIINHEGMFGFSSPISALNSRLFEYVQSESYIDSFLVGDGDIAGHGFPPEVLKASGVSRSILNERGWNFLARLLKA